MSVEWTEAGPGCHRPLCHQRAIVAPSSTVIRMYLLLCPPLHQLWAVHHTCGMMWDNPVSDTWARGKKLRLPHLPVALGVPGALSDSSVMLGTGNPLRLSQAQLLLPPPTPDISPDAGSPLALLFSFCPSVGWYALNSLSLLESCQL